MPAPYQARCEGILTYSNSLTFPPDAQEAGVPDGEAVAPNWCSLPKVTGLVSLAFQSLALPGMPCWFGWVVKGTMQGTA